jgi:plastocyanin
LTHLIRNIQRGRWWGAILVFGVALTLLLSACGGTTSTGATSSSAPTATPAPTQPASSTATSSTPTQTVQIKIVENNGKYSFQPASVTIPKGAEIVWTNMSDAPHTVTSDSNAFTGSSTFMQNQTFKMTFNTAGTFAYHCSIHTYMKATIIVTG